MKSKYPLIITQIIVHLSIIPMVIFGSAEHYLIAFVVYMTTGCLGMSMTVHRLLSHRSWNAPVWFERFGSLAATYGLTGTPLAWVATHRQHHHHTDVEGDPHSPVTLGFFRSHYLSMIPTPDLSYVRDLMKDPLQKFLHRRYWRIHLGIVAFLLLVDPFSIVYAYLFPNMLLWNAGSAINSIGHTFGYQNFKIKNNSKNNWALGYIAWGEGWHNNHHAYPSASQFGRKWFEFDLGGLLIRWIEVKKPVSKPVVVAT